MIIKVIYEELLEKAGKFTMHVDRLKVLCTEIYKSINNVSPSYIPEIFCLTLLRLGYFDLLRTGGGGGTLCPPPP